jgi:hypothetical protein
MEIEKYTVIMPLKINNLNSFKIFTEISLPLYNKYLEINNLECFYIISPINDIETIRKYTDLYTSIPFSFIDENTLLDKNVFDIEGWYKQQIIKLMVANVIQTKYYLVLDSDLYLNQLLRYEDLFYNNKLKYSQQPWQTVNDKYYSTNSNWWISSCNILNYPVENLYDQKYLMGVTPQILITENVKNLINHLKELYCSEWQKRICEMKFTEYTLYWIYLMKNNLTELYSIDGKQLWKHDLDRNILYYHTEEEVITIVNRSINDKDTYFSVIQSYLPVNIDMIKNILLKNTYKAIFLLASMTCPNRYQAFSREERVQQTIETVNNIRKYIPNSFCILVEGTVLTDEERCKYKQNYDHILELGNDKSILPYINHNSNIGHGEMKLLERGIDFILQNNIFADYVFKLTPRYKLTDKFNLNNYKKDKYCFREHYDESINSKVFTTGLYSIPVNELNNYRNILIKGQNILSVNCHMVEKLYVEMIASEKIFLIEDLGLEGMLSYNKFYFNK